MADKTKIEWTDATWNPIRGCSRVSEGCRNCYAERVAARFGGPGQPYQGLAAMKPEGPRWTGSVQLVERHLLDPLNWRIPRRIFVNSMSDLFHEKVEVEWLDTIFAIMALCPRHTFQILTKRPERMRDYLLNIQNEDKDTHRWADCASHILGGPQHRRKIENRDWPLPNVWMGISVEDQTTADERVPVLLETPAAVRWVSYEPALGPVDFFGHAIKEIGAEIDWMVCGGESGPGARPSHPDWFRGVRDQCQAAGVPFFMKQICERGRKIPFEDFLSDLQIREFPNATPWDETNRRSKR